MGETMYQCQMAGLDVLLAGNGDNAACKAGTGWHSPQWLHREMHGMMRLNKMDD